MTRFAKRCASGLVLVAGLAGCQSAGDGAEPELFEAMTAADYERAGATLQEALENGDPGETYRWENRETGHSGTITPENAFSIEDRLCRNYSETVRAANDAASYDGYACRTGEGAWVLPEGS